MSIFSAHRRSRAACLVSLTLAASATLIPLTAFAPATATSLAGKAARAHPRPTIVLVHGAWANESSWNKVVVRLTKRGYKVAVAPNQLRSLSYDTAYLKDYLSGIKGPIVLVGHSYGGAVISDASTGNKQVKALVFDDAYIPAKGENVATLSTAKSALAPASKNPASVFKLTPYPNPPAPGVVDTYLLPKIVYKDFAPDVSRSEARLLALTQSPTSLAALGEPSTTPGWKTIPSWDVVGRQDKIIPVAAQLAMARRAKSHITKINSSHVSLISHPRAVTRVILRAVNATK